MLPVERVVCCGESESQAKQGDSRTRYTIGKSHATFRINRITMTTRIILGATALFAMSVPRLLIGDEPVDAKVVESYRAYASSNPGDPQAGEVVFQTNKNAQCTNCHRITGMEKSGPNLDGIGEKYNRDELILHLLQPSASIKQGYGQTRLLLDDGKILTGRIEKANKEVIRIMDLQGERVNVSRKKIEEVVHSDVSLMPVGCATSITQTEFADLIAYLQTLRFGVKEGLVAGGRAISIPHLQNPIAFVPIHSPEIKFENPVWCSGFPGTDDELVILEHQSARIWRYIRGDGPPRKELFADFGKEIHFGGDQGLTAIAFHPDFATNRRYFLEHEVRESGKVMTTIVERKAAADGLKDSGAPFIRLIEVEQPATNHNGGCIAFGPDGMLYAGFGDGGPQKDPNGYAQSHENLLGSFIRIDVDHRDDGKPYSIPKDNPFVALHQENSASFPEIWATGFREPWRFSFDPLTGELWVGDVGQSKYEEVIVVEGGKNYGWNVREGFGPFSDEYAREGEHYTDPLFAYEHGLGFSVTGGYVYRADPDSSFYGVYIFGDYNTRRIWGLKRGSDGEIEVRDLATAPCDVASFGMGNHGELFLVSYGGTIYQLDLAATKFE